MKTHLSKAMKLIEKSCLSKVTDYRHIIMKEAQQYIQQIIESSAKAFSKELKFIIEQFYNYKARTQSFLD